MSSSSEFVPLQSIIRGALLVPDFNEETIGEYIIVDIIDGNMFIRVKEMQGKYKSCLGALQSCFPMYKQSFNYFIKN